MNIIDLLLPLALLLAGSFSLFFITAVCRGQFDDLQTPAHRILLEDEFSESPLNARTHATNRFVEKVSQEKV